MALEYLDYEGLKTYNSLLLNWVSSAPLYMPTCIWAGRGCIDLDALKGVDYILIGPSNKRPILWVTSKELKALTKSFSELYQEFIAAGGKTYDQYSDELDFKVAFEAFIDRELNLSTGITYTTENEHNQFYKLGSRYYLKLGRRHSSIIVPKNLIIGGMRGEFNMFLNPNRLDGWKYALNISLEKGYTDKVLAYCHPELHKYAYNYYNSGEKACSYLYAVGFLGRKSKNGGDSGYNTKIVNNTKKEFRPVEIVQNPFHRKIGGALKIIREGGTGKIIELRRVSKTPRVMYEKCLKRILEFDEHGYNITPLRYKTPLYFKYKSPSIHRQWLSLFRCASSHYKRVFGSKDREHTGRGKCKQGLGFWRPHLSLRSLNISRVRLRTRPFKNGAIRYGVVYAAYRNPFYSGLFTQYDICGKIRIKTLGGNAFTIPEFEKLLPQGNAKVYYPIGWMPLTQADRLKYYETQYLSPQARQVRSQLTNGQWTPESLTKAATTIPFKPYKTTYYHYKDNNHIKLVSAGDARLYGSWDNYYSKIGGDVKYIKFIFK